MWSRRSNCYECKCLTCCSKQGNATHVLANQQLHLMLTVPATPKNRLCAKPVSHSKPCCVKATTHGGAYRSIAIGLSRTYCEDACHKLPRFERCRKGRRSASCPIRLKAATLPRGSRVCMVSNGGMQRFNKHKKSSLDIFRLTRKQP